MLSQRGSCHTGGDIKPRNKLELLWEEMLPGGTMATLAAFPAGPGYGRHSWLASDSQMSHKAGNFHA